MRAGDCRRACCPAEALVGRPKSSQFGVGLTPVVTVWRRVPGFPITCDVGDSGDHGDSDHPPPLRQLGLQSTYATTSQSIPDWRRVQKVLVSRSRAISAIPAINHPLPIYPTSSQGIPVWREFERFHPKSSHIGVDFDASGYCLA
jgi:hypothetical protein